MVFVAAHTVTLQESLSSDRGHTLTYPLNCENPNEHLELFTHLSNTRNGVEADQKKVKGFSNIPGVKGISFFLIICQTLTFSEECGLTICIFRGNEKADDFVVWLDKSKWTFQYLN